MRPRLALCMILLAAAGLADARPALAGPVVEVPAPQVSGPDPVWRCQVRLQAGGGGLAVGRDLDAKGAIQSQTAQWTDGHIGDRSRPATLLITWRRAPGPLRFDDGVVNLYIYGELPLLETLRLTIELDGRARTFDAGHGWERPAEATAYFPAKALKASAASGRWRLEERDVADWRPAREGALDLAAVNAARSALDKAKAELDAAQADPKARCHSMAAARQP